MYNTNPRSDVQRRSIRLLLKQMDGLRVDCTSLLFFRHETAIPKSEICSVHTVPSGPSATKAAPAAISAISEIADLFADVYEVVIEAQSVDFCGNR